MTLGFNAIDILKLEQKVDSKEFFLAALFHDSGKMYDYEWIPDGLRDGDPTPLEWRATEHR